MIPLERRRDLLGIGSGNDVAAAVNSSCVIGCEFCLVKREGRAGCGELELSLRRSRTGSTCSTSSIISPSSAISNFISVAENWPKPQKRRFLARETS